MRNIFLLAFVIACALSCTKSKNVAKTTSGGSGTVYGFLPNVKQDTLYASGPYATQIDTIFTFKSGDTSYVTYKGVKLYLFYYQTGTAIDHSDTAAVQINCYLNTIPLDTIGAWSACTFQPYKYYSVSYAEYRYVNQILMLSKVYPHFDTANGSTYYHL